MTIQGHRSERIAEEIRNEVSLMLAGELKDPRLAAPVLVTEVRLDAGMRTVRVFVSVAGDPASVRIRFGTKPSLRCTPSRRDLAVPVAACGSMALMRSMVNSPLQKGSHLGP